VVEEETIGAGLQLASPHQMKTCTRKHKGAETEMVRGVAKRSEIGVLN